MSAAEKTLGNLGQVGKLFGDAAKAFRDPVRGVLEGIREAKAGLDDVLPRREARPIDFVGECPACGGNLERKYGGHGDRLYCTKCCASFPDRNAPSADSSANRRPNDERGHSAKARRIEDDE